MWYDKKILRSTALDGNFEKARRRFGTQCKKKERIAKRFLKRQYCTKPSQKRREKRKKRYEGFF